MSDTNRDLRIILVVRFEADRSLQTWIAKHHRELYNYMRSSTHRLMTSETLNQGELSLFLRIDVNLNEIHGNYEINQVPPFRRLFRSGKFWYT